MHSITTSPATGWRGDRIALVADGRDLRAKTSTQPPAGVVADGPLLERSGELGALRAELATVRATGTGRLVMIAGDAGIGKTALVRAFCAELGTTRVLSGACDALLTPRPLGPLADIAEQTGGELAVAVDDGATAGDLLAALVRETRRRPPTVLVLEDLHWADQVTLDVLRLLGRRSEAAPALVVGTFRDDELGRAHPLRVVLGELPTTGRRRIDLRPLSAMAVEALAAPLGIAAGDLHTWTAGNPFFVTETLAAGGTTIPTSVRDAVLARAARLDAGARAVLDAVSVSPLRIEHGLLEALVGDQLADLEQCLTSGMLRTERDGIGFRHEIARAAVEDALPLDQSVALHRKAFRALTQRPRTQQDLARIAHHAEAAGDGDAVLRYASLAAEQAAALGAHREAAAQFGRALRHADRIDGGQRAALLERRSYECYLTNALDDAIDACREALEERRRQGDRLREGDAHRRLSRFLQRRAGANAECRAEARRAVELLEGLPAGPELAMAWSTMSQLAMVGDDTEGARRWGEQARSLAERLGETETVVHALNNLGTAELSDGLMVGVGKLERSLSLAREAGLDDHVARAHSNLVSSGVELRDFALAERHLEVGVAFCRERDLESTGLVLEGWRARLALDQGRWEPAAEAAGAVLGRSGAPAPARILALMVVGRLRARRGHGDPWGPLDDAAALARGTEEIQWIGPVAAARAEARWLEGADALALAETEDALARATAHRRPWAIGELRAWRRRCGVGGEAERPAEAEPFDLELSGRHAQAAAAWEALGCPYDAAMALAAGDDEALQRRALAVVQGLGAARAGARIARTLRERGVRNVPQGPRASTRENVAGLTARELEVLTLLDAGLRNAEIAQRLVLSARTVEHHVSAILGKLSVRTRTEAVLEARRLGVLHPEG